MAVEELKYFFSYTRADSEFVLRLAKELRAVGANLWLDQLDILGGKHWDRTVEEALKNCKGMIAVLSPESAASDNVMDEVSYALNEKKLVVPVLLRTCNIPLRLQRLQYVDFTGNYDAGFSQLLRALSIEQPVKPSESAAIEEPAVREPLLAKQPESTPDTPDHSKPAGVEAEQAHTMSPKTKVLAAICIITVIVVVSIVIFLNGQPEAGDVVTNSIDMKLVYVPAGSFIMGSPPTEKGRSPAEGPQHQVRISKGFWMGQTEVTQGQYNSVMNAQPWSGKAGVQENPNNPAVWVSWDGAVEFCRKLSQQTGETYRLPTEAEWEYACRAGTTTPFSFGENASSAGDYAWFEDNATDQKHAGFARPVGGKKPNPWNLYDMHGNVWEFCSDYHDPDYYSESPSIDPKGPSSDGRNHVVRGGSWFDPGGAMRCAARTEFVEDRYSKYSFGFRVVRSQS